MAFQCGPSFLFAVLTLLTIGASTVVFVFLVIYFNKIHMKSVSESLLIGVIIGLCVSILVLLYGAYASCCGGRCHKLVLTVLYLVFSLVLGAIGVALLAVKGEVEKGLAMLWSTGKTDVTDSLEEGFSCKGWGEASDSCKTVIMDFYSKWGTIAGGALIGLFVLLMIGVVFACRFICRSRADEGSEKGSAAQPGARDQFTAPLAYGW